MTPLAMADVAPSTRTREGSCLRALATGRDPLPERRIERRVDIPCECLPLRIESLKLLCGHARVLGRIDTASMLLRNAGQAVKQVKADLADREIEGERNAGCGKGKHSRRRYVSEDLDDGEKRAKTGYSDGFENVDDSHLLVRFPRQHALELQEAAFAVHAVPVQKAVERIEKRLVIDEAGFFFAQLLVVIKGVEESDGEFVHSELRDIERQKKPRLFAALERLGLFAMIALHEDAASEVVAGGYAIDPRDCVFHVRAGLRQRDKLIDADEFRTLILN